MLVQSSKDRPCHSGSTCVGLNCVARHCPPPGRALVAPPMEAMKWAHREKKATNNLHGTIGVIHYENSPRVLMVLRWQVFSQTSVDLLARQKTEGSANTTGIVHSSWLQIRWETYTNEPLPLLKRSPNNMTGAVTLLITVYSHL
jgi:hypothetical protein